MQPMQIVPLGRNSLAEVLGRCPAGARHCSISVPERGPRKSLQIGPNPVDITEHGLNLGRISPKWTPVEFGRDASNPSRNPTEIDQICVESTEFGSMSSALGPTSTNLGPTSAKVRLNWTKFGQDLPGIGQTWPWIGQVWPEVDPDRPMFDWNRPKSTDGGTASTKLGFWPRSTLAPDFEHDWHEIYTKVGQDGPGNGQIWLEHGRLWPEFVRIWATRGGGKIIILEHKLGSAIV